MNKIGPELDLDAVIIRLGEECSEVIKEVFKGHRYGFDTKWDGMTPMDRLKSEVKDVKRCIKAFERRLKDV